MPRSYPLDQPAWGERLRQTRSVLMTRPARSAAAVPARAALASRTFTCPSGACDYELYIPGDAPAPHALVVMLHGSTQDAQDFAAGTGMNEVAEEYRFIVAYPIQPRSANASCSWNWFRPKHQQRDSGEAGTIAALTLALIAEFRIDRDRVFIAGMSAGGALAAVMGAAYPELYRAVGVHSGLRSGAADTVAAALAAMRRGVKPRAERRRGLQHQPRTIVFHGSIDRVVHPSNGDTIMAEAKAQANVHREEVFSGRASGGADYVRSVAKSRTGVPLVEHWLVRGIGHAWCGGHADGSYTDWRGPDASREMARFFLAGT